MCSSVERKPYLTKAALAALYPPPYAGEASLAIWCMKKSPSLFSTMDFPPFFEDEDEDEDEDEAADVDGMALDLGITSDSSHMYDSN